MFIMMQLYAYSEIRELCKKYNLEPISAHVPFDDLNDNTEKEMAEKLGMTKGAFGYKIWEQRKILQQCLES